MAEENLSYITRTKLLKMGKLVFIDIICNIKDAVEANTFFTMGFLSNMYTLFPNEVNCIGLNSSLGIFPIRGIIDGKSVRIFTISELDKNTQIFLSGLIMMERLDL